MRSPARIHIICNPTAGKGRAKKLLPKVRRLLEESGHEVESSETSGPGDASGIAKQSGADIILALGGDGTLNEIVNGLTRPELCLGVLPAGTGNDFCKALGVRSLEDTLATVRSMHCRSIDLAHVDVIEEGGKVHGRYFVNTMGIGFDAAVAIEVARSRVGTGILPYLLAVLRTLRTFSSVPAIVVYNNCVINSSMFLSCIGNGSTSGGGFRLTPSAVPDDGLLDLCHVAHVGLARVLRVLPMAMRGAHIREREVTEARAAHFEIELSFPLPVHLDGEILTRSARKLVVTVRPSALRFLAPAQ